MNLQQHIIFYTLMMPVNNHVIYIINVMEYKVQYFPVRCSRGGAGVHSRVHPDTSNEQNQSNKITNKSTFHLLLLQSNVEEKVSSSYFLRHCLVLSDAHCSRLKYTFLLRKSAVVSCY